MATVSGAGGLSPRQIRKIRLEPDLEKLVLIISREELNRGHGCTTVMFTTRRLVERARLPNCVYFPSGRFGLTEDCVAQCETVAYTYSDEFIDEVGLVGTIDDRHWQEIVMAIGDVIEAACHAV